MIQQITVFCMRLRWSTRTVPSFISITQPKYQLPSHTVIHSSLIITGGNTSVLFSVIVLDSSLKILRASLFEGRSMLLSVRVASCVSSLSNSQRKNCTDRIKILQTYPHFRYYSKKGSLQNIHPSYQKIRKSLSITKWWNTGCNSHWQQNTSSFKWRSPQDFERGVQNNNRN